MLRALSSESSKLLTEVKTRRTTCLLILLAATLYVPALARPADDERTEKVLTAALASIGSKHAVGRVRSIEAIAECTGPKGKYTTSITSFSNDRTVFSQTYTYSPVASQVFINGMFTWERSPDGQMVLSSTLQRMVTRMHEYQRMVLDPRSFFNDLEYAGDAVFADRAVVEIRAKNELGWPAHLYFDKSSGRFVGYQLDIPNSTETVRNIFTRWQTTGGVSLPAEVKAIDKAGEWTLQFHTIRLNRADPRRVDIPPRVADLAELMRLHEQQKTAHLTYNAEMFVEMFAEQLTQLQRGALTTRTRAEDLQRFKTYFSSFKFAEWEDIAPPLMRLSKDGTLATIAVQKRVRGTYKDDSGAEKSDHTIYAWLEVWEKVDGKWKVVTVASTEKDGAK